MTTNAVKSYKPTSPAPRSDRARNAPLAAAHVVVGRHPITSKPREAVRLELRGSRKSLRLYAFVRVMTRDGGMAIGHGSTRGSGYHKPSDAAEVAIEAAGYRMNAAFGGHGEAAMHEALRAIAEYNGYTDCTVIAIED